LIAFLSLKSFRNRKFISFLCILSISLSLSLFLIVEKLRSGIEEGFTNSISNADLIVGARSGPLQLLLYTVFHMGSPTNNIRMKSYEKIKEHSAVDWTIPISLGDSYRGYRVVATDKNFLNHYQFHGDMKLRLDQGEWSNGVFDVVLGSQVANNLEHKLSDPVILSHGISEKAIFNHDSTPFRVTGVLAPTGTPVDKSLFITLYGMEAIHVGWENGIPSSNVSLDKFKKENLETEQITSFVLRTKNRVALLGLQRFIGNYENESLSAIIPAVTLTELWGMLDQLENGFLGISFFVIVIGFLTILISLYMSLDQRQREMAILRSVGVTAREITYLLLVEATILSIIGTLSGLVFQYVILFTIGPIIEAKYSLLIPIAAPSTRELVIVGGFAILGSLFGLVPALKAYGNSLAHGLQVKN
jgi:putative ABC transport system permease protein